MILIAFLVGLANFRNWGAAFFIFFVASAFAEWLLPPYSIYLFDLFLDTPIALAAFLAGHWLRNKVDQKKSAD